MLRSLARQMRTMARDLWFNTVISSSLMPRPLRWRLLRLSGLAVERCRIDPDCFIGSTRISIGEGAYLNREVFLDGSDDLHIGTRVRIGMRATILTSTHDLGPSTMRAGPHRTAPVTIGNGTWIGANATILPGITIGPGCVIAAGAVVTTDCAPNHLYAGTPAKQIRPLT